MSIVKSLSLVLATAPYRESSLLLHLFSRELGRIHGLVKGVRRGDKRGVPVERGILLEHTVYLKPERDLHLVTDCSIVEYFPNIRNNLEKTAVRDVVLDVALAAIKDTEPHKALYDTIVSYYEQLSEHTFADAALLFHLARQLFLVARQMGFGVDFSCCAKCGKQFGTARSGILDIAGGACLCSTCVPHVNRSGTWLFTMPEHLLLQSEQSVSVLSGDATLRTEDAMAAVYAAVEFCRYHLEVRKKLASVTFLNQLFTMATF